MTYEEESGDIVMAFTGDCLITRRLAVYREPNFLEMARILRDADVSFTNSEGLFHNFESPPIPDAGPYGTYASCDPKIIEDLKWLGIDMVSTANNHCYDYGEGGIVANLDYLDQYGLPHAGTGRDLTEAVTPAYLDTPKGSVALLGITITMPPQDHHAGNARGKTKGRPGANVLRQQTTNIVPRPTFDALAEAARGLGLGRPLPDGATEMTFAGQRFSVGDSFGRESVMNAADRDLNLKWIREARRMAEWVVVSVHCHQGGATQDDPAPVTVEFAKACIDAGADAVFGHGPHRDRGIEIYKGKPIMYSLATLVLHNDLIKWQPDDMFGKFDLPYDATTSDAYDFRSGNETRGAAIDFLQFQTTMVEAHYNAKELSELVLYPLDLGFDTHSRRMRGRPVLADEPLANEILSRMQKLSEPFGTKIEIAHGRGVIKVG